MNYFNIVLFSSLCFVSTFYHIESPIIAMEDKWYASICLSLLYVMMSCISIIKTRNKNYTNYFTHICIIITLTSILLSGYGILQALKFCSSFSTLGISGNFDNPAGYAISICCGIPTTLYLMQGSTRKTIYGITCIILIFVALVLSKSRTGILTSTTIFIFWLIISNKNIYYKYLYPLIMTFPIGCIGLYYLHPESIHGRILIWRCCLDMVKEKPLTGWGSNGFIEQYMNFQANYFTVHSNSKYQLLAGNIQQPFNEYLSLLISYGIIGAILLCLFIIFIGYLYKQNPCLESKVALTYFIGLGTFALFSYPLSYPLPWIMAGMCSLILIVKSNIYLRIPHRTLFCKILLAVSTYTFITFLHRIQNEIKWINLSQKSQYSFNETTLKQYQHLLPSLKNNNLFLYNYAAVLYNKGQYKQCIEIAEACKKQWADYDLELLLGYASTKCNLIEQAKKHFEIASHMCPARFIPLYELFKIYKSEGKSKEAQTIATLIINKPIKIPSNKTNQIIYESKIFIGEQ